LITTRTMLALTLGFAAIAVAADYEKSPVLPAKDIVPAAILAGKGYTIDSKVPTEGLLGRYTIRSAAGTFPAHGLDMLSVRVSELPAIQHLKGVSRSKVFLSAARGAAEKPVKAAVNIVTHPKETVQGLPAGIGRFFDRVQSGANRLVEAASGAGSDEDRAGAILKGGGTAARDALGYEQERRSLARELKVDPYTSNPVLAKLLDDVAWVSFTGRLGTNVVMSAVVPGSIVITATRFTNDLVWDTPRGDLIVRNETALKDFEVPEKTAHAFMANAAIPLSVKTDLVEALEKLGDVKGRPAVVALAATARSEEQARFLVAAVRLLGKGHGLEEMTATGTVVGREKGDAIVVPAPVDYVSWTERVARFANRADLKVAERSIVLTGNMSPRARKEFEALGWKVSEDVRKDVRKDVR
jgi:hypothetical protein